MATIHCDVETIRATETGSALGQIWIEFGGQAFPQARWDDFVVFVLDWWRLGIRNLLTGAKGPAVFAFMDDMYEVAVGPVEGGLVCTCKFHDNEIAKVTEDIPGTQEFVKSYCDVVQGVLERVKRDPDWRQTFEGSVPQV